MKKRLIAIAIAAAVAAPLTGNMPTFGVDGFGYNNPPPKPNRKSEAAAIQRASRKRRRSRR